MRVSAFPGSPQNNTPAPYIGTPTTATLQSIPSGKAGIVETLKIMSRLVREGKKELPIRQLALSLVSHLNQKDWPGEIRVLHAFVRDRIRYVKDIHRVETLHSAVKILESGQGDCDDKSIILASLLESIGHHTRFVAIALKNNNDYVHVYPETLTGPKQSPTWLPLETTEPVEAGWSPENISKRLIYFN